MKNILCFGDSNTYGYIPIDGGRYDRNTRWTGVLSTLLGNDYYVIEEGCNGRTTAFPDPEEPWKNSIPYIRPCLNTHKPVDVIVVMLGSNDLKKVFNLTAKEIAFGMEKVINEIIDFTSYKQGYVPRIIIMSPPIIGEKIESSPFGESFDVSAIERSKQLAYEYEILAEKYGCEYIRTSDYIESSAEDSLHLTWGAHKRLAEVVCRMIENEA